jgi:hypothetical protein
MPGKSDTNGPRGDFLVVNLRLGFALSCTLKAYDGNKPPPEPILFFTLPDDGPSRFDDRIQAQDAINRTIAWSERHGYGWEAVDYNIWTVAAWEAIRSRRRPGGARRARRPATPEEVLDA